MSQLKRKPVIHMNEDEPPTKKLISDANLYIKKLSQKQLATITTLQEYVINFHI